MKVPTGRREGLFGVRFHKAGTVGSGVAKDNVNLVLIQGLMDLRGKGVCVRDARYRNDAIEVVLPGRGRRFGGFALSIGSGGAFCRPSIPAIPLGLTKRLQARSGSGLRHVLVMRSGSRLHGCLFRSFSPVCGMRMYGGNGRTLAVMGRF